MLRLDNITKIYKMGDVETHALKGINIEFRKNEFVSILGPSGCGKTTMLNIIGGLDRYTDGDLLINEKSTKQFNDKDWDNYRNHSIGFVFQGYNLISHQSVLENVELALTLSGVSKAERKKKAIAVLTKVGLKDKIKNKPNQLSGGQMQRVAIARALVNDPEIILADEPTGALDTESSLQVMELLKEISKDKLIIMVTHNPELAEKYSSRIVRVLDGNVMDDSNPYKEEEKKNEKQLLSVTDDSELTKKEVTKKNKKKNMSFLTALSLSFKNLLTKKARTILTSVAGSIGIIGIALILAISSGFNTYVNKIQEDTLSSYPVQLTNSSYDMASLMQIFMSGSDSNSEHKDDKVHINSELTEMLNKFNSSSSKNDLKSFKEYIEGDGKTELEKYTNAIQYVYDINVNAFYKAGEGELGEENGLICVNPATVFSEVIEAYPANHPLTTQDQQLRYNLLGMMFGSTSTFYSNEFWDETIDNQELLKTQYNLVGGKWASEYNEVMVVVDENGEISDYTLYGLGLLNQKDLEGLLDDYINNKNNTKLDKTFEYSDLLKIKYKILLESDYYENNGDGTFSDIRKLKNPDKDSGQLPNLEEYNKKIQNLYDTKGIEIKVVGVIKENQNSSAHSITACIAYNSALTKYVIEQTNKSEVVFTQIANPTKNIITGNSFADELKASLEPGQIITPEQEAYGIKALFSKNLSKMGCADLDDPTGIYLYPIDFEAKNKIGTYIDNYNKMRLNNNEDTKIITYTDTIGTMMSSVSTIITSITYVLVAFVGVSLIVSSIMIGIITYISVIERTKEIGVLRSVGASKRDIRHVFTAESFIIGLASGLFGILVTLIFTIPINIILKSLTGIGGIAQLPVLSAFILITISVLLTLIAGLIPARIAAKKDPVVALRTE